MKNVEIMPTTQAPKKSWVQRNLPTFAAAGAALGGLVASSSSMAFLAAADVTTATTSAGGEEVIKTAGIWVLTIAVGIAVFYKIVSIVKK
jgi:hypothetical protein